LYIALLGALVDTFYKKGNRYSKINIRESDVSEMMVAIMAKP